MRINKSTFDRQTEVKLPNTDGYYRSNWDNVEIEYIFLKGNDKLIVFFSALYPGSGKRFQRWTYANHIKETVICLMDPRCSIIQDKNQGYYYGTNEKDYRMVVANFIMKVATNVEIDYENIWLVGDSNAATAALFINKYINKSNCIAINPQVTWPRYSEKLQNILKTELNKNQFEISSLMCNPADGYSLLLFIKNSPDDVQSINYFSKIIMKEVSYPIEIFKNSIIWTFDTDYIDNHVAIDDHIIFKLLISYFKNWGDVDYARMINEIWTLKYECLRKIHIEVIRSLNNNYDYRGMAKFFLECGYKYTSVGGGH